ncbi:hypothetical protein ACTA71_005781 [Dictyostelium dimigraforme]
MDDLNKNKPQQDLHPNEAKLESAYAITQQGQAAQFDQKEIELPFYKEKKKNETIENHNEFTSINQEQSIEIENLKSELAIKNEIIDNQRKQIEEQNHQIHLIQMVMNLIKYVKEENINGDPVLKKIENLADDILAKATENDQMTGILFKKVDIYCSTLCQFILKRVGDINTNDNFKKDIYNMIQSSTGKMNINSEEILNEIKRENGLIMKTESVLDRIKKLNIQQAPNYQKRVDNSKIPTNENCLPQFEDCNNINKNNQGPINNTSGPTFSITSQVKGYMDIKKKINLIIISSKYNCNYFEPIKQYLNKCDRYLSPNSSYYIAFNLEKSEFNSFLNTDEPKSKHTFVLYVKHSTGSRSDFDAYKDQLSDLNKKSNVILTFLLAGETSSPVEVDGYKGIILNFHFSNERIRDTDVSKESRNKLIKYICNIIQD